MQKSKRPSVPLAEPEPIRPADSATSGGLWARDNLLAWGVVPFDLRQREPEKRAQMLERLGFRNFAYSWRKKHIPSFETEIETLQRHRIRLLAWALYDSEDPGTLPDWGQRTLDDPLAQLGVDSPGSTVLSLEGLLELFKRHNVHPQLWLVRRPRFPQLSKPFEKMTAKELRRLETRAARGDLQKMPQEERVRQEADRVALLAELAAPYGCQVELYNHNGWFGMIENQLAILERLHERGEANVGIVYNFSHARDEFHDDTTGFATLWGKMRQHVVAVNITGTHAEGTLLYPSQGDRELEMMRTIQQSGWRGAIGLIAEKGGDAEVTLRDSLKGFDWLAAELKQPGSGGSPPFVRPS